ncbi:MAG: Maf family protein [Lentisphaeria bacterium]|nr:Maf family protein [Lentisphaeria bacterium]
MADTAEPLRLAVGEKLVLASASPRRQQLLAEAGIGYTSQAAEIDETPRPDESATGLVQRLAASKAAQVAQVHPGRLVLGADTVVVLDGKIYGKPTGLSDARAMLLAFSGRRHQVLTGVCLVRRSAATGREASRTWVCTTHVTFRTLSQKDVDGYFQLVNPLDKAGAYGIQEHGDLLVVKIEGLLSNVIGLPVEELFPPPSAVSAAPPRMAPRQP